MLILKSLQKVSRLQSSSFELCEHKIRRTVLDECNSDMRKIKTMKQVQSSLKILSSFEWFLSFFFLSYIKKQKQTEQLFGKP